MPKLMEDVMDFYDVGKRELFKHECDPHSLTRTKTHKGGWFGLPGLSPESKVGGLVPL